MKKNHEESSLRKATRENFEQYNGGPLSDAECEEIEKNFIGFAKCLLDIDNKIKDKILDEGGVKCVKCSCPIMTKQEFHYTSSTPMCYSCYKKEYEEKIS
jgi:hypothetical protein